MVSLGLVSISLPEVGHSVIETFTLAEVGSDLHAVTGAGVRPGQCPAADPGVQGQLTGRKALYLHRAFHVAQLPHVVVATDAATKPAEEDVARCLHQLLAGTDAMSLILLDALREVGFQHRALTSVCGVVARSLAMMAAALRRNVNGEEIMRAYQIGARSGSRFFACASRRSTGSGRSDAGAHPAWMPLGVL